MNLFNSLYTDDLASFYFNNWQIIKQEEKETARNNWLIEQENQGVKI